MNGSTSWRERAPSRSTRAYCSLGQSAEQTHAPVTDFAAEFRRAQDRGPFRDIGVTAAGHGALRRTPDAAAVKELRVAPVGTDAITGPAFAEPEYGRPLEKEGPLFRIIAFSGTEIDYGRVDLYLAGIGVQGEVEGQAVA